MLPRGRPCPPDERQPRHDQLSTRGRPVNPGRQAVAATPRPRRLTRPGTRRRRATALANALLLARVQEAMLWYTAETSHRAGILGSLSHTYRAIAASYDPDAVPAGLADRMASAEPYTELAQLARLLSDSERRLASGRDALPLTWHQLPAYVQQLEGDEGQAWTRFYLSTSRSERSDLLRTTLAAAASARLGSQAAAFLALTGWTEHAIAADPSQLPDRQSEGGHEQGQQAAQVQGADRLARPATTDPGEVK